MPLLPPLPRWLALGSLSFACAFLIPTAKADSQVYLDSNAPLEDRVNNLFGQLSQDDKIRLLRGQEPTCWSTVAVPSLHIPQMVTVDGAQGIRGGNDDSFGPATLFAGGTLLSSTWDLDLVGRVAKGIAVECKNKANGAQMVLGPGINIHRSPLSGRNGEYYSEDPYLTARLSVAYIQGMQSEKVAACVKHYVCNNEEADRGDMSAQVSERALREIYLYAFEASIKEGHSWGIMAAYNKVRGKYMTMNHYLLTDVLRTDWGWDGVVLSDWGATHGPEAFHDGLDLDMAYNGEGGSRPAAVQAALRSGELHQEDIDNAVKCTLRAIIRVGLLDNPPKPDHALVNSQANNVLSQEASEKGIVLLKNEGNLLPLDANGIHSIALIGPGMESSQLGADGSPHVDPLPANTVQPRAGIEKRLGGNVTIHYALGTAPAPSVIPTTSFTLADNPLQNGLKAEYFANANLQDSATKTQTDPAIDFNWTKNDSKAGPVEGVGINNFSVRWTGKITAPVTGHYTFVFSSDDGCRLFVNGKQIIDHWVPGTGDPNLGGIDLQGGQSYDFRAEYFQGTGAALANLKWMVPQEHPYQEAVAAAQSSDVAIVCVTTKGTELEGTDRPSMFLPNDQDQLVKAVLAANKKTIVVVNSGTPVDMSAWLAQTPALLQMWFPGQQGGHSLAEIVFGDINPSGKLPDTFGVHREDYPDYGNYHGSVVKYTEGIYVGYRWFDHKNITPSFPFGFGLSYTTFAYANVRLSQPQLAHDGKVQVSVDVTNSGKRAGDEIVELYVHDPSPKIEKAERELKGFARVSLAPGEMKTVTLTLTPRDFAYCDVPDKQWKADAGDYEIQVGGSSRDLPQKTTVHLSDDFTEAIPDLRNATVETSD